MNISKFFVSIGNDNVCPWETSLKLLSLYNINFVVRDRLKFPVSTYHSTGLHVTIIILIELNEMSRHISSTCSSMSLQIDATYS